MKDTNNGMSIVVPFLNESDGIELFCKTIDDYTCLLSFNVELIFVNDGSSDDTSLKVRNYPFENVQLVKLINLSKNYGSHAAIRAGISEATYPVCTWMGSDLQEPLEMLQLAWDKICAERYDAVYIEKKSIKVSVSNRLFSRMYSYLMKKYAVKNYSSVGISTIVFNEKIKKYLNENIELNSSIILQIMDVGYQYYTLSMNFNERAIGKSKWTFSKKVKIFIDSFVAFSFAPIRFVSIIGFIIFALGGIIGLITFANKCITPSVPIGYSTLASIMGMGFGITNISLGIIAEYLWRAYDASRKRPVFVISSIDSIKI